MSGGHHFGNSKQLERLYFAMVPVSATTYERGERALF
jgi:hypothetical protein